MTTTDPRARLHEIKARAEGNYYAHAPTAKGVFDTHSMVAALTAVLDLHKPADLLGEQVCEECIEYDPSGLSGSMPYPCPTFTAITDALGGDRG